MLCMKYKYCVTKLIHFPMQVSDQKQYCLQGEVSLFYCLIKIKSVGQLCERYDYISEFTVEKETVGERKVCLKK